MKQKHRKATVVHLNNSKPYINVAKKLQKPVKKKELEINQETGEVLTGKQTNALQNRRLAAKKKENV